MLSDQRRISVKRRMMNGSTRCPKMNTEFTKIYLPTVYVTVFVTGVFANCWGLKSMFKNWEKMGNIRIFVLNLGIADLLYISTLPFLAYIERKSYWTFGQTFCKMTRFCFNLNLYGSIGFLTCISIYRYLGIVHTMETKGRITSLRSVAVAAIVWLLVCLQITPDVYFQKTPANMSRQYCFDTTVHERIREYLSYSLAWTVTGFCIPLLIIAGCYSHVALVLSRRDSVDPLLKKSSIRLVVTLTVLHCVCFIPYHVFRNLNLKTRVLQKEGVCHESYGMIYLAHQVCRGLVCLNSTINPVMYLFSYNDIYTHVQKIRHKTRGHVAQLTANII